MTWYSRTIAIIVLLAGLPILGFYFGMQYQKVVDTWAHVEPVSPLILPSSIANKSNNQSPLSATSSATSTIDTSTIIKK